MLNIRQHLHIAHTSFVCMHVHILLTLASRNDMYAVWTDVNPHANASKRYYMCTQSSDFFFMFVFHSFNTFLAYD